MLANTSGAQRGRVFRPRIVLIAGGKGGVGTTTMAVNLAVALAQRGIRTVLVDADSHGGDVATLCRLDDAHSLAGVLAGRSTVAESLQPGPGGIRVLAGIWALERVSDYPPSACEAMALQLGGLSDVADWILVDAGQASSAMALTMWRAADLMLLVTTVDDASVMDTYAAIKILYTRKPSATVSTLVNAVPCCEDSDGVHARLARACRRFLGFEPAAIGRVDSDPDIRLAASRGDPFVLTMPASTVARQVDRAARNLHSLPILHRQAG